MLVVNGALVTLGEDKRIIADGALRIEGMRIMDLGSSAELRARYPEELCLDAQGMLVMPGMICAHTHLDAPFARGLKRSQAEKTQTTRDLRWELDVALGYEDIRYSTLASCITAIRHGTTTLFGQHSSPRAVPYSLDAVAEATLQAGLRACLSYEVSDHLSVANGRQGIEENARFAKRIKGEPLLAASMGLQASVTLSDGTLSAAVGAAALSNVGFHVHVAADSADVRDCLARYGLCPAERFRKRGVLGPRTIAADCVHISPAEMDLLRESRAWVVHNPRANASEGTGPAPVPEMLKHGLRVCLGSDIFPSSMFHEMQAAYLLHKQRGAPNALSEDGITQIVLQNNGALASRICRDKLGELTAGALADVILVAYPGPAPITEDNLASHLVSGADAFHVDTTIVGGRVLMRHGSLLTIDEEAITARACELGRLLWARL